MFAGPGYNSVHLMRCVIQYHLHNFKKREKHSWCSCRLKPATLLKVTLLHGCFSRFLNCADFTKLHKTSQIIVSASKPSLSNFSFFLIVLCPVYSGSFFETFHTKGQYNSIRLIESCECIPGAFPQIFTVPIFQPLSTNLTK